MYIPLLLLCLVSSTFGNEFDFSAFGNEIDDEERRLQVLPSVLSVAFQDADVVKYSIGGRLSWTPPPPSTPFWNEVNGYKVYLGDDKGNQRLYIASVAGSGSLYYDIPPNTPLSNYTTFWVHTVSPLGESPVGYSLPVCDVDHTDTIYVVNAAATSAPWGVIEISFHQHPTCQSPAMGWATYGSTGYLAGFPSGNAIDKSYATAWVSNCTACGIGQSSIGIIGVCEVTSVRCIKLRQCLAGTTSGGACPSAVGRTTALALMVRGEHMYTFKVLTPENLQNIYTEETLSVASRRRRANYGLFSDTEVEDARTTNPQFTR